jgi:hypothetical protein
VAALVASTLGVWTPVARAAPDAEALVVEAEEALGAGEYADAAALFERAYMALSARERTGQLGEHLVLSAAEAREKAWLGSDTVAELEEASRLLDKHIATVEARGAEPGAEVTTTKSRLDAIIAKLGSARSDPPPEDDPLPGPVVDEPGTLSDGPAVRDTPPNTSRPDVLGLSLVIGGSVLTVGGAVMLGVGAALPGWAEDRLAERGGTSEQDDVFLSDAKRAGVGLMAGGGVMAGVGVVAIIVGAVRLVRRNKRAATARVPGTRDTYLDVAVSPVLTPQRAGASLQLRW